MAHRDLGWGWDAPGAAAWWYAGAVLSWRPPRQVDAAAPEDLPLVVAGGGSTSRTKRGSGSWRRAWPAPTPTAVDARSTRAGDRGGAPARATPLPAGAPRWRRRSTPRCASPRLDARLAALRLTHAQESR
ncbi:MAG: hypothetical protein R3F59_38205 [Myxococcota bacterium]